LTGDTGSGKTATVKQICARMNQPMMRENITGSTKVEHLLQEQVIDSKNKEIKYQDKALPICAEKGYTLLIDEISAGTPQVMFLFFRVLETGEVKTFDNRIIKCHPHFKIIFTDNRIGNPNFYRYHGTQQQNIALVGRITTTIFFPYLSEENEKNVLVQKYAIEKSFATNLVQFAGLVRKETEEGNFGEPLSTRDLEHITKNYKIYGDKRKALQVGFLNKIQEKDQKDFVINLWERKFGHN
jgi:MoxR-like ATPase